MKHVECYVGTPLGDSPSCDFGTEYFGDASRLLAKARDLTKFLGTIRTNRPECVAALMALVRRGEIKLSIYRFEVETYEWTRFTVDDRGDLIKPWPDQFFELDYQFLFNPKHL